METISPTGNPLPVITRGVPAEPAVGLTVIPAAGIGAGGSGDASVTGARRYAGASKPGSDAAAWMAATGRKQDATNANASELRRRRGVIVHGPRQQTLLLGGHNCGGCSEVFSWVKA